MLQSLCVATGWTTSFFWYKNHLWSCGDNEDGSLGQGKNFFAPNSVDLFKPVIDEKTGLSPWGIEPILGLVAGAGHTIVWNKKELWLCGSSYHGQLGVGDDHNRPSFTNLVNFNSFHAAQEGIILGAAAGACNTFFWTPKKLFMCGNNDCGQLGLGDQKSRYNFAEMFNPPWGNENILGVTAGNYHTIVRTKQGLFVCGNNQHGQLGLGNYTNCHIFTPLWNQTTSQQPWVNENILEVTAGPHHTIVRTKRNLFVCGNNQHGQLGLGDKTDRPNFTRVFDQTTGQPPWGNEDILGVATGRSHTAVWTKQGLFVCGGNEYGQLGLGDRTDRPTFTRVWNLATRQQPWENEDILGVTAGAYHTIVRTKQGLFVCGFNHYGQLGLGDNNNYSKSILSFIQIPNLSIMLETRMREESSLIQETIPLRKLFLSGSYGGSYGTFPEFKK